MARRSAYRHQRPGRCRWSTHHLWLADLQGSCPFRFPSPCRAHREQGRDCHRQVEHAGVRGRRLHFQQGVRTHTQPVEHGAHARWFDRRRRAALAAGDLWLAHGSDHAGSLRRPATYCSVVGLRPSPVRVTRGTSNNLFAPLLVQGPMARNVKGRGAVPRYNGRPMSA